MHLVMVLDLVQGLFFHVFFLFFSLVSCQKLHFLSLFLKSVRIVLLLCQNVTNELYITIKCSPNVNIDLQYLLVIKQMFYMHLNVSFILCCILNRNKEYGVFLFSPLNL